MKSAKEDSAFQILCLSGGGYLGLYSAVILEQIEQKLGRPIASAFDLISGTSIGGLLAIAVALEVPMADVVVELKKSGEKIFSNRKRPKNWVATLIDLGRSVLSPKYSNRELTKTLNEIYGVETLLGDIPNNRVLIPAVNLTLGKAQVFKTPHLQKYERDWKELATEVALATSAAPTYLPIAKVGDQLFADGGLYANSPDQIALHEAEYFLDIPRTQISTLSIGTTTSRYSIAHEAGVKFGLLKWAKNGRLASAMISAQQQNTQYMMEHVLGERYVRIDTDQSKEQERELALDVATKNAQKTISGLAEGAFRQNSSRIEQFLKHNSSKAKFYHGRHAQGGI